VKPVKRSSCIGSTVVLFFLGTGSLTAGGQQAGPSAPNVIAEFDIPTDGDSISLPVTISARTYRFAFDTGSSCHFFDRRLKGLLRPYGQTTRVKAADGLIELELFKSPVATLAVLSLQTDTPVVCADFATFYRTFGLKIDGMIGMAFLKDHVVSMDYDRGRLAFLREADPGPSTPIPLIMDEGVPTVDVKLGTATSRLTIDTGASGFGAGCLGREVFDDLRARGAVLDLGRAFGTGLVGHRETGQGAVSEMSLGPFRQTGRRFVEQAGASRLGLGYLRQFNVVFDFPRRVMYLRKSRHYGEPDRFDRSGLRLERQDDETIVQSIRPGSPAAGIDVRPGDVVTAVDGADAKTLRLHAIRRILSDPGRKVRLSLRRAAEPLELSLPL
jgi:hypothetical protein